LIGLNNIKNKYILYDYSGKQLRASLNDGKILKKKIDYNKLKNYLGRVGYAARVLYVDHYVFLSACRHAQAER